MTRVVTPGQAPVPPPLTFSDLMKFDLGEHYYVRVVRKAPKIFEGTRCDVQQWSITRKMTVEEFARTYGGTRYELTVYGPPSGTLDSKTSRPIRVALTKPISVSVPGLPPSLRFSLGCDEVIRQQGRDADARLYDARDFPLLSEQRSERLSLLQIERDRDNALESARELRDQLTESKAQTAALLRALTDVLEARKGSNG